MIHRYPRTPDGRYFLVRGRLWRCARPNLNDAERNSLVHDLMTARSDVRRFVQDACKLKDARHRVHSAKVALGERGAVWWDDGAPDFNRHLARNTPYSEWAAGLSLSPETTIKA
jgi:hypothetical protein